MSHSRRAAPRGALLLLALGAVAVLGGQGEPNTNDQGEGPMRLSAIRSEGVVCGAQDIGFGLPGMWQASDLHRDRVAEGEIGGQDERRQSLAVPSMQTVVSVDADSPLPWAEVGEHGHSLGVSADGADWARVAPAPAVSSVVEVGVALLAPTATPKPTVQALSVPRRYDGPGYPGWPESEWGNVHVVEGCESTYGLDPETYNLNAAHGGRMQICKDCWADFFWETEGWTWEQVVRDDAIHFRAAWIIWERRGQVWSGPWPTCGLLAGYE